MDLYMQEALGRCDDAEIHKKKKKKDVRRMIRAGTPVYAFLDLPWVTKRYRVERDGELWSVQLRRSKRWSPKRASRAKAK